MSADNGIYIAKFPDGYRVCYGSAIDNLTYYPAGTIERKSELRSYFGQSPVFESRSQAVLEADMISRGYDVLEHGIQYIGEFEWFY